jgi:hypothetical protein
LTLTKWWASTRAFINCLQIDYWQTIANMI